MNHRSPIRVNPPPADAEVRSTLQFSGLCTILPNRPGRSILRREVAKLARHLIGAPEEAQLFDDGSRDVALPVCLKGIRIKRSRQFGAALLVAPRLCAPSSELDIAEDWYRRTALADLLRAVEDLGNAAEPRRPR
jgi:hypothetical protein